MGGEENKWVEEDAGPDGGCEEEDAGLSNDCGACGELVRLLLSCRREGIPMIRL